MTLGKSVVTRLMLAFGSVIIVFGAAVGMSIGRLAAFNTAISGITGSAFTKVETANDWSVRLLQTARHTRNALILDDKNEIQSELDAIVDDKAKRKEDMEALTVSVTSAAEKASLQAVVDSRSAYLPLEDEFLREVKAGQLKESKELLLERMRPAQLAYLDTLVKFSLLQKNQLKKQADVLAASYRSTRTLLTAVSLCAVAIACLLTWSITRAIRNPLRKVITHFEQMRQGNFKEEIVVTSRDEIGQVLAALKETQQKLLDASIKAADYQGQIEAIGKAQAVVEFGLDETVLTANDNFLDVLGYRLDEVKGKHHSMFAEPDYRNSAEYRQFWDKLRRGENAAGMFKRIGQGGREIWLQSSYNPIFDPDGKAYKVVTYAADVSEQVRKKKDLDNAVTDTQTVVKSAIEGDLVSRIPMQGKTGEIAALCQGINTLLEATMTLIRSVKTSTREVQSGVEEISRGNTDLSQRTEEQASSLEETATSMEQMTSSVKQTAGNAGQANQLATAAKQQAENGGAIVASAVTAMSQINTSSKRIADIIGVIDEIAFQTNLLALNAAVEAARAGEQGRGFAVVASEVRNLAGRSATAAKEIKGLIQDSVAKVDEGSKLVYESGKALEDIVASVKKVSDIVSEIAAASREQSAGIEQVNKAVIEMDETTQQNVTLVEESAVASQSIVDQAKALNDVVAQYRVGEDVRATAVVAAPKKASGLIAVERRDPKRPWAKSVKSPASAPRVPSASTSGTRKAATNGASGDDEWTEF